MGRGRGVGGRDQRGCPKPTGPRSTCTLGQTHGSRLGQLRAQGQRGPRGTSPVLCIPSHSTGSVLGDAGWGCEAECSSPRCLDSQGHRLQWRLAGAGWVKGHAHGSLTPSILQLVRAEPVTQAACSWRRSGRGRAAGGPGPLGPPQASCWPGSGFCSACEQVSQAPPGVREAQAQRPGGSCRRARFREGAGRCGWVSPCL